MASDQSRFVRAQAWFRGWPLWFWILAPIALVIVIACCAIGLSRWVQWQQEAAEKKREAAENKAREEAVEDDRQYGKEDDAKKFARSCYFSHVLHFRGGDVDLAGRSVQEVIDERGTTRLGEGTQAKLDRETGHWTVTGIVERHRKGSEAEEADWEAIVSYSPSDGVWHQVSFKLDEETVTYRFPNERVTWQAIETKFHPRKHEQP